MNIRTNITETWLEKQAHQDSSMVMINSQAKEKIKDTADGCSVLRIQSGVDLVEEVERSRITSLDGKDQCQCHHCHLSPGQLFHGLSVSLASEGNLKRD